jgi:predicted transposase/invertase (TIGR01784 family)
MYLDEKEKGYYDAQQKFWLDQNTFIKETVEKAVEKAELSKQTEMAKNGISKGYDNQIVADITGLSVEQIEQLRSKKAE